MAEIHPDSEDEFSQSGGASVFDPWTYLAAVKRFWWIPAICVAVGLSAGFLIVKLSQPEFVSTAEIKIERRAASSAISLSGGGSVGWEGATAPEDLKTIEKSFISPMLIERVVAGIREGGFEALMLGGSPATSLRDDVMAGWLMKGSGVALIPETRLIQISFTNTDPLMAQKVTNLIMTQGIQYDLDQRIAATGSNVRYLREEVKKLEENLRTSEEKLNSYTRTLGNVSIDSDLNIVATQLRELNTRSTIAKADRLRIESDYAQIQSCLGDPAKLMKIETIQKMPSITSLAAQVAEVQSKIGKLSLRYRDSNPFMMQARSELKELEAALQNEIIQAPKSIEAALAGAKRAEENILREQALQEEKVIQVRDLAVPSRVLQRQIDADRLAYEAALKRLSEELSQARSQPVLLQVVNPAGYGVPSGSGSIKLLGMAFFFSFLVGFGTIFLITQLDSSIKSPEEAERTLGLSVLSAVPEYPALKEKLAEGVPPREETFANACPALGDKHSATAEALRSLRTALRSMEGEKSGGLILMTAPLAGDGASFCAANLAVILAQAGQRTLLVDANLREPTIEQTVLQSRGRPGLSDYLQKGDSLATVIQPTSVARLDIVPAGTPCSFPAETLSRQRFEVFLAEASHLYEKIVVDSAALCSVSDTLAFVRLFPTVCIVTRSGKTPRAAAKRAIELLRRAGVQPAGLVFNSSAVSFSGGLRNFDFLPAVRLHGSQAPARVEDVAAPRSKDLRDLSEVGERRRKIFGELFDYLQAMGMPANEAREHLLLALKMWRSEVADETTLVTHSPADERTKILSSMLDSLVKAGLTPDQAKAKMLEALKTWKSTP